MDEPESEMLPSDRLLQQPALTTKRTGRFVKHVSGYYVFFDAGFVFASGFDRQGGGNIGVSADGEKMWLLGLTDAMRQRLASKARKFK